jgi:DNA-binding transcriptional ArsR family regulator
MVNNPALLDTVFSALADPTRRSILRGLMGGSAPVGRIAEPFCVSAPAVSRHLRVLEGAGLIRRTKRGRIHEIELKAEPLRKAADWLDIYRRHWESSLDALARYLESPAPPPAPVVPLAPKQSKNKHKPTN